MSLATFNETSDTFRALDAMLSKYLPEPHEQRATRQGLPTPQEIRAAAGRGLLKFPQRIRRGHSTRITNGKQDRRGQRAPKRGERLEMLREACEDGPITIKACIKLFGLSNVSGWPYISQLEEAGFVKIHRAPHCKGDSTIEPIDNTD